MRILLVSSYDLSLPGGVTSHVRDLAEEFRVQGHDVEVAGPGGSGPLEKPDNTHYLCSTSRLLSPGDAAFVNLSPGVIPNVRRFLKERPNFDVIHIHEPFVPFLGPSFLTFANSVKVATFHSWRRGPHLPYIAFWPILQMINLPLTGRIAVSQFARSTIKRYVPGDYRIIPNGVDFKRFERPQPVPEHLRDDKPTILCVGRLEARKGIEHLLRAFSRLKQSIPNARLVLIGEGGLRPKYEAFAARLGLSDVLFQGYVSDADLPAYYQRANVVCAPSTTNESFGITLVEAMASGTPVVATRMGGYAQVTTHGVNGMLVKPGDETVLAETLQQVLEDSSLHDRLVDGGITRAQDFDWPNVAGQIISYYAELASSRETVLSTSDI